MMIIELFGLPGSGKSTITDLAVEQLILKQYKVKTLCDYRKERETSFLCVIGKNLRLTFLLFRFLLTEHMKIDRDKIRYIKSILMTIEFYKHHTDDDILIMEQGWIQDIVSLCFDHKIVKYTCLSKICESIGGVFVPVATTIDINESFSRMLTRDKEPGRLDKKSSNEDQKRIYKVMHENLALIKNMLSCCLELDTTMAPEENAETIVEKIVSGGYSYAKTDKTNY